MCVHIGVWTTKCSYKSSRRTMERVTKEGDSPVNENEVALVVSRVPLDTRNRRGNERRPLRKAKYYLVTDRDKYCEGKVKRTPGGE